LVGLSGSEYIVTKNVPGYCSQDTTTRRALSKEKAEPKPKPKAKPKPRKVEVVISGEGKFGLWEGYLDEDFPLHPGRDRLLYRLFRRVSGLFKGNGEALCQ